MRFLKTLLISLCIVIAVVLFSTISNAKYVLDCTHVAISFEIDRTKPVGIVTYSTKEMTRDSVQVIINLSEPILQVEGWNLSEDKLTLTKNYIQNSTEAIEIIDLSGNENLVEISVQNIDRDAPVISLVNMENTNSNYKNYANKTHTITATIKITDLKINDDIDISKIDVIVGNNCNLCTKTIENLKKLDTEITFDLILDNIVGNDNLEIKMPDGFVIDIAGNTAQETLINTGVIIDNIKPQGEYSQEVLQSGKVKAKITANEEIVSLNTWNTIDSKVFIKEFPANVKYNIELIDFAQNKSEVEVNVTNATYIVLKYASHNSAVGWTYGWKNCEIAGKDAVKENPLYKTEALAIRMSGSVQNDFVRMKGYVHSYWNDKCDYGKCDSTGYKYELGDVGELSMASDNLSTIDGEKYMQIGGAGINAYNTSDYNGNNPIPREVLYENHIYAYPYGVSEIQISLTDYSEFSVIYQILVNNEGWLKSASNGESITAGKTKAMSALRIAIVPKTESDNVVKFWDKNVGTYNVD